MSTRLAPYSHVQIARTTLIQVIGFGSVCALTQLAALRPLRARPARVSDDVERGVRRALRAIALLVGLERVRRARGRQIAAAAAPIRADKK